MWLISVLVFTLQIMTWFLFGYLNLFHHVWGKECWKEAIVFCFFENTKMMIVMWRCVWEGEKSRRCTAQANAHHRYDLSNLSAASLGLPIRFRRGLVGSAHHGGSFWVMRPLAWMQGRVGWHCGSTGTKLCQERECQRPATLLLRTSQAIRLLRQWAAAWTVKQRKEEEGTGPAITDI